jgi:tricorn protease
LVFSVVLALGAPVASATGEAAVGLPRYPSISPDGSQIVFSWHGDLWRVAATGGLAQRLTSHPGDETKSAWSPDGTMIAFNSTRSGANTIHIMNADGSGSRLLADVDRGLAISGFSPDGKDVLCSGSMEGDVYRAERPYRVSVEGGPVRRVHDAFGMAPQESPAASRDVVFVRGDASWWWRRHYRGPDSRDLWVFRPSDGSFQQLTTWRGNDSHPAFADADTILFLADRELDTVNLWAMDLPAGEASARRLTGFENVDIHEFDVARDGKTAVFHAWDTLYTLDLTRPGATPVALAITAPDSDADNFVIQDVSRKVSEAALSPDGKVMATIAEGDIFIRHVDEGQPTRRITDTPARERDLAWSPDGVSLYYSADPDGTDSIFRVGVAKTRSEVRDATIAALKPPAPEPAPEPEPEPAPEAPAADAPKVEEAAGEEDAPKKDEAKNGDAKKKDDKDKKPTPGERWHDAVTFTIEPLVDTEFNDRHPTPSPDGKSLAFRRTRGDIMVMDLESRAVSTFLESWNPFGEWTWSPDSTHIAYVDADVDYNYEIFIKPVDGSTPAVNISRHPNNEGAPRFSADGKILAFLSQRDGDDMDVYAVSLDKSIDALAPLDRKKYYDDAAEAAKKRKPLEASKPKADDAAEGDDAEKSEPETEETKPAIAESWSLDDAWLRIRQITNYNGDESNLFLTPAGDRFIFSAEGGPGEDPALFSIKWDGKDLQKLTGRAAVQHLNLDGSKAIIVQQSRAATVGTGEKAKVEFVDPSYSARIDLEARMSQMFREAARELGMKFYHQTMKGLDWPALTERYHALATRARTGEEFAYVGNRLLGELNASHLGVRPPNEPNPNAQPIGRLGIDTTPEAGGYRVRFVVPLGPADAGDMSLAEGDLITAINYQPIGLDHATIEQALRGHTGDECIVSVTRARADGPDLALDLLLIPISFGREVGLRYDAWRNRNAELVTQWSNGQLGYIHIRGMDQGSLDTFERDLYAAAYGRKGLVIDVRSNGGGWTADRLLSSIMVQPHAYTIARGDTSGNNAGYPQDRLFIQRYTRPITMLCNEKSFSNAEITAHAFKALKRGTLVGQQTYGGVISTGGFSLVDGTFVRLPFRGWYLMDGTDMENNGAIPDLIVPQTPTDEAADQPWGYDRQLKAAVDELLGRTGT